MVPTSCGVDTVDLMRTRIKILRLSRRYCIAFTVMILISRAVFNVSCRRYQQFCTFTCSYQWLLFPAKRAHGICFWRIVRFSDRHLCSNWLIFIVRQHNCRAILLWEFYLSVCLSVTLWYWVQLINQSTFVKRHKSRANRRRLYILSNFLAMTGPPLQFSERKNNDVREFRESNALKEALNTGWVQKWRFLTSQNLNGPKR